MDMAQSAAPQDPAQPAAPQGFVIEVECHPDGTFVISKEDMETPAQESTEEGGEGEGSADGDEGGGQKANSVGEMLKIVMSIAKTGATDGGQSQFMAGYNEPTEPA